MRDGRLSQLRQLAHLYHVQTVYQDMFRRRNEASPEALLATLNVLGCPVRHLSDVPEALRVSREAVWRRVCEPVIVAWNGGPIAFDLSLPSSFADGLLTFCIQCETGSVHKGTIHLEKFSNVETTRVGGLCYVKKRIVLSQKLPFGYHRMMSEVQGLSFEALIIAAPFQAYSPPEKLLPKTWGIFLPLYALSSQKSFGGGHFSDLEGLVDWVGELGGGIVATLPLLTTFLDECFEPSPYSPVSRFFWNEFYIDVRGIPEFRRSPKTQALFESRMFKKELGELQSSQYVDYRRGMVWKRRALEQLAGDFFAGSSARRFQAFQRFVKENPAVKDYARFRATCEQQRRPWSRWPQQLRNGNLRKGDFDEGAMRYHLYVQWVADEQLKAVSETARRCGPGLYFDLPLGVNASGYDVWREQSTFVLDARVGAPPDTVFTKGQDWRLPPLHPEKIRAQGYRYVIAYLQHHLKYAGILRIDHIMGLHRLFWIPKGFNAAQGVYVRYRDEEFYAILCLESHRTKSVIVGENLGIVPPEVNASMERHGIQRMFIVQYELPTSPRKALRTITPDVVASLNTHDMFPFSTFWKGSDIDERVRLELLDKSVARQERKKRQTIRNIVMRMLGRLGWLNSNLKNTDDILCACLKFLSASPARIVLINVEDLWLETEPQNIPGTGRRRPNWRRKARYTFKEWTTSSLVMDMLRDIGRLRKTRTASRWSRGSCRS